MPRMTVPEVIKAKGQRKLTMLTAYESAMARFVDQGGIDMILVGDSLAMVVLGHEDTLSVTMDEMLHHTRAVTRVAGNSLIVADLPFMSYQVSVEEAVINAGRMLKEGRAGAVKVEGGDSILPQIQGMVKAGIPVMGHLGLTPQSIAHFGGFKVQGRGEAGEKIVQEARKLEEAGCFSLVLEAVPPGLASRITSSLNIPTIGIGAGLECDGQVLVINDLLGMSTGPGPRFVKKYADLAGVISEAVERYRREVQNGEFPDESHCYKDS
ncbi:3-methyl-2-oxobutanoate hydroxymethyltransferase [Desulfonatronospira sp. MSAO_Bac3]|uniref:3-methyl-2-oxobutanoate hydroxymethyltransferase n=1 Tax=Desulfonatronospira sp. MSAO_Bac3 TaxID=2293857 RepID=UPI000FF506CA|nr:3-methyl-2-oxobutanoate hydroxymethyltransferase [Desulfonatronospira sp. MSAO_Bac3]RQD78406.1 MAG: 3-methyl-2-oxobutanoate hydroxymethyltransferase [Desulfonatronospira sp. MSAO_Bac3]